MSPRSIAESALRGTCAAAGVVATTFVAVLLGAATLVPDELIPDGSIPDSSIRVISTDDISPVTTGGATRTTVRAGLRTGIDRMRSSPESTMNALWSGLAFAGGAIGSYAGSPKKFRSASIEFAAPHSRHAGSSAPIGD